jgi:N-acetylmuramoyl-L-alanine amidase
MSLAILLGLGLFLTPLTSAFAEAPPSSVRPAEERVSLPEAARGLGVTTQWKPAEGKLLLTHGNHCAEILIGADRVRLDGYLLTLAAPVIAADDAVTMLLADTAALFSRLLERTVTVKEISAGFPGTPRIEDSERNRIERVRHVSYPDFTRLMINLSEGGNVGGVKLKHIEGAAALEIDFPQTGVEQATASIDVGDRFVKRIEVGRTNSGARIIVRTNADDFEYETQRYSEPARIIVDVKPAASGVLADLRASAYLPAQSRAWGEPEPERVRGTTPFTTVVIDPGHGGKDHGARGRGGLLEKDVTLSIALKLKERLEAAGVRVILTRSDDSFVSLRGRTVIANRAKNGAPADLFISIHTNSHASSSVEGFEAYYVSDAIDPGAEATAALENAVVSLEDTDGPEGALVANILWDLQYAEFIADSSELAFITQEEFGKRLETRDRGVRQARFIVLSGVAMPSVLVEVGFISNRSEEARLKTEDFKNKCAECLGAAVTVFKERYEAKLGLVNEGSSP